MHLNLMKIRTRLALGLGMMALLVALVGSVSLAKTVIVHEAFRSMVQDQYPKIDTLHRIKDLLAANEVAIHSLLYYQDRTSVAAQVAVIRDTRKHLSEQLTSLRSQTRTAADRAALDRFEAPRARYIELENRYVDAIQAGRADAARTVLQTDIAGMRTDYHQALNDLFQLHNAVMTAALTDATSLASQVRWAVGAAIGAALAAALALWLWIGRSVARPMAQAVDIANAVVAGELAPPHRWQQR